MATGTISLGRQCGAFETLAPTTSTGITAALIKPVRIDGVAQATGATSITLVSTASSTTNFYVGWKVQTKNSAAGPEQERTITAYNGSTKAATVSTWGTTPTSTTPYVLIPPFEGLDAQEAVIVVDGATNQPIRWRCDGIAPTATVGNYLSPGAMLTLSGSVNIKAFRCIDTAAGTSSVTVNVMF